MHDETMGQKKAPTMITFGDTDILTQAAMSSSYLLGATDTTRSRQNRKAEER